MTIKIETEPVLSAELSTVVTKVASKYYPDGVIKYYGTPAALQKSIQSKNYVYFTYYPTSEEHPPLALIVKGNQVIGVDYGTDFDIKPKLRAFIDAFNEAKERVVAKQQAQVQPTKPVQAPPAKPVQAPKAPAKPQLPTVYISKFNDLDLPNSAVNWTHDSTRTFDVQHDVTEATGTHYLLICYYVPRSKDDYRMHRIMGKSVPELVSKLETFLELPAGSLNMLQDTIMTQKYGQLPVINSKKLANFLAQCPIKK